MSKHTQCPVSAAFDVRYTSGVEGITADSNINGDYSREWHYDNGDVEFSLVMTLHTRKVSSCCVTVWAEYMIHKKKPTVLQAMVLRHHWTGDSLG